jgi:hypothetical protein
MALRSAVKVPMLFKSVCSPFLRLRGQLSSALALALCVGLKASSAAAENMPVAPPPPPVPVPLPPNVKPTAAPTIPPKPVAPAKPAPSGPAPVAPKTGQATETSTLPNPADRVVSKNRAPKWQYEWSHLDKARAGEPTEVRPGHHLKMKLLALDEDGDELMYDIKDAPANAKFHPGHYPFPATFEWTPTESDVGDHDVTFIVRDREATVPVLVRFSVTAVPETPAQVEAPKEAVHIERDPEERDWNTFLMPGAGMSILSPASNTWGTFVGGGVEFLIAAWIHSNENRGPSHGRIILKLDILKPSRQEGAALQAALGVDLSIERNPARSWLVPFYGLDTGLLVHRSFESNTVGYVTPLFGIHGFSTRNLFISASVGYLLPMSSRYFDELRSVQGSLSVDFSLW